MIKAVRKFLFCYEYFYEYLRILYDFSPLVAVAAGGKHEEHTGFRRCAAPEKIRIGRTEGSKRGELKGTGMALFMGKKGKKGERKNKF